MTTSRLSQQVELLMTSLTTMVEQAVERAMERRLPTTTPAPADGDQLVGVAEAARRLALSTSTIYKMAGRVDVPSGKLGGRRLFRQQELAALSDQDRRSRGPAA